MDSVGEGEGGMIWENGIEIRIISYMKRVASPGLMHEHLRLLSDVKLLSCVRLFVTPWTVACQAPPSMGFLRQEH